MLGRSASRWNLASLTAPASEPVQRSELLREMPQEVAWIQRLTRDRGHQLRRTVPLALPVNRPVEPRLEGQELSAPQLLRQIAQLGLGFGEELCRIEVPQCVRREVSEASPAPVDVLQASARVVGRPDPEKALHPIGPGCGQLRDGKVAVDQ